MKKNSLFLTIIFSTFLFSQKAKAQFKNDTQAAFYDMGLGAIVGGIGAVINKKDKEKTGKVFIKGFWQGALGGYVVFESKRLIRTGVNQNTYGYFWPSKIVNSVGNSILENASANRNFWEQYHINVGFNRLEFDFKKKGKLSYKMMPFALSATVVGFVNGNLDVNKSLSVGTFIFKSKQPIFAKIFYNVSANAYAYTNQIVYDAELFSFRTLSHEIIHTYQYEQAVNFNSFFIRPLESFKEKSKFIKSYNKIFYTDFNLAVYYGMYRLNSNHDSNFLEREARFYSE